MSLTSVGKEHDPKGLPAQPAGRMQLIERYTAALTVQNAGEQ
jgi:hypothetical protein